MQLPAQQSAGSACLFLSILMPACLPSLTQPSQTPTHPCMHTRTLRHACMHMQAHAHTLLHAISHTSMHAHAHACTCAHTYSPLPSRKRSIRQIHQGASRAWGWTTLRASPQPAWPSLFLVAPLPAPRARRQVHAHSGTRTQIHTHLYLHAHTNTHTNTHRPLHARIPIS